MVELKKSADRPAKSTLQHRFFEQGSMTALE
jgi:hypothetical protein